MIEGKRPPDGRPRNSFIGQMTNQERCRNWKLYKSSLKEITSNREEWSMRVANQPTG